MNHTPDASGASHLKSSAKFSPSPSVARGCAAGVVLMIAGGTWVLAGGLLWWWCAMMAVAERDPTPAMRHARGIAWSVEIALVLFALGLVVAIVSRVHFVKQRRIAAAGESASKDGRA